MSHTVTITKRPDETSDDIEYHFGGTHDANCEFYAICPNAQHRHPKNPDNFEDGWSTKQVPEVHQYLDGEWMVAVDQEERCALSFVFEGWSEEDALGGVALGETRDVSCIWDGEGWELEVSPAAVRLEDEASE